MHVDGSYRLDAPLKETWNFVSDPEKIGRCLPGLEHLDVKDSKNFSATLKAGISFVRGSFKFTFTLLDQLPPSHSRFEATGRGAGVSVKLKTLMDLMDLGNGRTQLDWKADAELGGLLTELSPSLIQNSATKFAKEFFDCVKQKLESA